MEQNSNNATAQEELVIEEAMEVVIEKVGISEEPVQMDVQETSHKFLKVKDFSELRNADGTSLLDKYSGPIYIWMPANTSQPPTTPAQVDSPVSNALQPIATPESVDLPVSNAPQPIATPERVYLPVSKAPKPIAPTEMVALTVLNASQPIPTPQMVDSIATPESVDLPVSNAPQPIATPESVDTPVSNAPQPIATPERVDTPVSWTSETNTPWTSTTPKRATTPVSLTSETNTPRTPKTPKRAFNSTSSSPDSNTPRTPKTPKREIKSTSRTPCSNTPRTPKTPKREIKSTSSTPSSNTPRTPKTPKTPKKATKSASSTPGSWSKRFIVDKTGSLLSDSGSGSDIVSSDDDDNGQRDEWADTEVLGDFTHRLTELQCEEENANEGDVVMEDVERGRERHTEVLGGEETMHVETDGAGDPVDLGKDTFTWSDNFDTFLGQEEVYKREPGPKIASSDPLEIFSAIWDVTIMGIIVKQTNLYAWQTIAAYSERGRIPNYLNSWVETTIDEMRRLFAVIMLMALDVRGQTADYWTRGILQMPGFREVMSRNRYTMLMKFLHFQDNTELPMNSTPYEKKIWKISNVVNYIQQKFSSLYTPAKELSLDETLLLWKGRLSWVQHIRSKAARFGIKSFELCESSTGYLLRSIMYAGKDSSFVEGAIHGFSNVSAKVVLELMDGYLDVGHLLVMDNWYNQLHLARYLKSRHTDVLGTLNANRMSLPSDIKQAKAKSMTRGERISRHCGDISVIAWKDVKLVTVLSTYHKDDLIVGLRARQPFTKPSAIETYNKTIGGVDLKDMKLSSYPMERKKGQKWYIKVFARILNTSITNAHIIHTKNPIINVLNHRDFRFALAQSLIKATQRTQVVRWSPAVTDDSKVRLDHMDHFPIHTEALTDKRAKYRRLRCKRCSLQGKRTEVNTMCSKCCTPLCIGQCWKDYHTLRKL